MDKLEKNIVHRINFERYKKIDMDYFETPMFRIQQKIATEIVEKYDEFVLELIYQAYKNTDCDSVIVLDKSEFKYFLLKYLPIYLKERNND